MSYTFDIVGEVPTIARYEGGVLFCNAPGGCVVTDEAGGVVHTSDHPVSEPLDLPPGRYTVTPNG